MIWVYNNIFSLPTHLIIKQFFIGNYFITFFKPTILKSCSIPVPVERAWCRKFSLITFLWHKVSAIFKLCLIQKKSFETLIVNNIYSYHYIIIMQFEKGVNYFNFLQWTSNLISRSLFIVNFHCACNFLSIIKK